MIKSLGVQEPGAKNCVSCLLMVTMVITYGGVGGNDLEDYITLFVCPTKLSDNLISTLHPETNELLIRLEQVPIRTK